MKFPTFDEAEELKLAWTDQYVRMKAGIPEYVRFEGKIGRVVTVNFSGRAIVDFADGAWYDIPATNDFLEFVPDDDAKGKFDPTMTSAQKLPVRQG